MPLPKLPIVEQFNWKKHLPQTSADKTNDLFYILSAIYSANEEDKEVSKITLTKALFRTAQIEAEKKVSFLNTFFYVNTLGPFNNIIYKYLEELEKANLIRTERRNIYITSKGSRVVNDLIDTLKDTNRQTERILATLAVKMKEYSGNVTKTIDETHNQKVIDTTDNDKIKTITTLIKEIKPEQSFKSASEFKYINPFTEGSIEKINLPAGTINYFENELASIDELDYDKSEDISALFT